MRLPIYVILYYAGQALQAASNVNSISKWKVVADKLGDSEGIGGLAALLLHANKGNTDTAPVTLPALVGPAGSSLSSHK